MAENRDFQTHFVGSVPFPISEMPEMVFGIHEKIRGHMSDYYGRKSTAGYIFADNSCVQF
jgi:hypothetical protein